MGCRVILYDTLKSPAAITITPTVHGTCGTDSTGRIKVTATGGRSPYTYIWNTGATGDSIGQLAFGTYLITATDSVGCTASKVINVAQSTSLFYTQGIIGYTHNCDSADGGYIATNTQGGTTPYVYSWSNGATTANISNLLTGSYYVTITDASLCRIASLYEIVSPSPVVIQQITITPACRGNNGAVTISASGGDSSENHQYTFIWSNGDTTFSGTDGVSSLGSLSTGSYSVTVEQGGSLATLPSWICKVTATFHIDTVAITFTSHNTCYGDSSGSIIAHATGGTLPFNYLWNGGNTSDTLSYIGSGVYHVTATNTAGCSVSASITLSPLDSAFRTTADIYYANCSPDSNAAIYIAVTGGLSPYSYHWNNGDTTKNLTNLSPGIYAQTITDGHNCQSVDSFVVSAHSPISLDTLGINSACGANKGVIVIKASGGTQSSPGFLYSWSNGDTLTTSAEDSIFNLSSGTYRVTVSQSGGGSGLPAWSCSVKDTFIISPTAIVSIISPSILDTCLGLSATLTAHTNVINPSYLWSNSDTTQAITISASGVYRVTVTDYLGCSAVKADTVTAPSSHFCCFSNPDTNIISLTAAIVYSDTLSIDSGSFVYIGAGTNLYINNTLNLINCEVVFGAGAQILIEAGDSLNILGSYLHSCDTMWKGVWDLEGEVKFDEHNGKRSRIEDAVYALRIDIEGYTELVMNTDFYRNQENVVIVSQDATHMDISNCNFGMGPYTSMLPAPHGYANYKRPLSGINCNTLGNLIIPNPSYGGQSNTFTNMNAGIIATGTSLYVTGNMFDSILDYEQIGNLNGSAISSSSDPYTGEQGALRVQTSNSMPDTNTTPAFKNCNIAINVTGQAAIITNNRMENVTYGVFAKACQSADSVNVIGNYINNVGYGISLINNSGATQLIDTNIIYVAPANNIFIIWPSFFPNIPPDTTYATTYAKTYGIEETEVVPSRTTIKHNVVYRGLNCIELNNATNTNIADNHLHLANSSAVSGNQAGLYAANCTNLLVSNNTFDGDSDYYSGTADTVSLLFTRYRKAGISLYNTYSGNLCDNIIGGTTHSTGLGYGMLYAGNCNDVQLYSNEINQNWYGLTLLSSGTGWVLDPQGTSTTYQNNDFIGGFTGTDATYSYVYSNNYQVPKFFYLSGQGSSYHPAIIDNGASPSQDGIIFQFITTGSPENCELIYSPGPQGGNGTYARIVAEDSGSYYMVRGIDSIAANWLVTKMLYESLNEDTATLNNDSLQNVFFNNESTTDIGAILQSELQNQLLMDSATLADTVSIGGKPSGYADALTDAIAYTNNIPTTNIQAANYVAMSNIYLQLVASGIDTFTGAQLDTIESLAVQCPYVAGDAVYMARSLYAQYDNTVFFNDLVICQPSVRRSERMLMVKRPDTTTAIIPIVIPSVEFVNLYPNPTKQNINLSFYAQTAGEVTFELIDQLGDVVMSAKLGMGQTFAQYSVSNLSNAIYYWRLKDAQRIIKVGKVAVMK